MASRWTEKERVALEEVRRRLKDEIQARPQYPDGTSVKLQVLIVIALNMPHIFLSQSLETGV